MIWLIGFGSPNPYLPAGMRGQLEAYYVQIHTINVDYMSPTMKAKYPGAWDSAASNQEVDSQQRVQ